MKFRFCGDGDCPDWVLAEIISTLAVLKHEDLLSLAQLVANKIIGVGFDELQIRAAVANVAEDAEKTAVACVHFILISAARHNVSVNILTEELQQLGLPTEHANLLGSVLEKNCELIRETLKKQSIKINELAYVETQPASSNAIDCVKLLLHINHSLVNGLPADQKLQLHIDKGNLGALLTDMRTVKKIMLKYKDGQTDITETET